MENLTGAELIALERKRQIEEEGYTGDRYSNPNEQLAMAAVCYASPDRFKVFDKFGSPLLWPWHQRYYKPCPHDRIRELVKAGALIAAEIDRLKALRDAGE